MRKRKSIKYILVFILLVSWLSWDLTQANKDRGTEYNTFRPVNSFQEYDYSDTKVSVVRSNDQDLSEPVDTNDDSLNYEQIEDMVRRSIELAGGLDAIIDKGDMVLLKPNIVDAEPSGSGEITDVRVIKALIKIIDELYPGEVEIVVGEGSPRPMDYEMDYQSKWRQPVWDELWDVAGYQDLFTDSYLENIDFRFSNLNGSPADNPWEDLREVEVPGGGESLPQGGKYFVHKDVINADVFISVPVLKIHSVNMTAVLKNQVGIAPSTRYGFSKNAGVPQDEYQHQLVHNEPPEYWIEKGIVDLSSIADIDFAVVDATACLETDKSARRSGSRITNLVRMNSIVAGPDPVAVDSVSARLMKLNPDDIEQITLAEKKGLGTADFDKIKIRGSSIEEASKYFKKSNSVTSDFGQSNREWILSQPFSVKGVKDPINHEFISSENNLNPVPGKEGWSRGYYFNQDRINLGDYYDDKFPEAEEEMASYAFTLFEAPRDQEVELWVGSDEPMKVYVNGKEVYNFRENRNFGPQKLVVDKKEFKLKKGENRLLVKTIQKYGEYDFTLNICEKVSDSRFDGNRVQGLEFKLPTE